MVDIKNPFSQFDFIDTDAQSATFLGGGNDTQARFVSQAFADITGGSRLGDDRLDDVLKAALTGRGAPGLEGVEVVSLSASGFAIALDGNEGSRDTLSFSGADAVAAIASVAGRGINISNPSSEVGLFDTDAQARFFLGGGNSTQANLVSQEFAAITGGATLATGRVDDLLQALLTGRGDAAGVDGVELLGLTDEGFTIGLTGNVGSIDTIIIAGTAATDAIAALDGGGVDIQNPFSQFAVFDAAEEPALFLGGSNAGQARFVSQEFADITGGSRLTQAAALDLFEALTTGRGGSAGVDGVELLGVDSDSFAFSITGNAGSRETILVTNVDKIDGADALGFTAAADEMAFI